jgi:hypothetical protein
MVLRAADCAMLTVCVLPTVLMVLRTADCAAYCLLTPPLVE